MTLNLSLGAGPGTPSTSVAALPLLSVNRIGLTETLPIMRSAPAYRARPAPETAARRAYSARSRQKTTPSSGSTTPPSLPFPLWGCRPVTRPRPWGGYRQTSSLCSGVRMTPVAFGKPRGGPAEQAAECQRRCDRKFYRPPELCEPDACPTNDALNECRASCEELGQVTQ